MKFIDGAYTDFILFICYIQINDYDEIDNAVTAFNTDNKTIWISDSTNYHIVSKITDQVGNNIISFYSYVPSINVEMILTLGFIAMTSGHIAQQQNMGPVKLSAQ